MRIFTVIALAALVIASVGVYKLVTGHQNIENETFTDRLKRRANEINASNTTWTAKFYDEYENMTEQDFKDKLGARPLSELEGFKFEDYEKKVTAEQLAATTLPAEFDARTQWPLCADVINHIDNQANCGSCWAVSSTAVMSDRLCIHSRNNHDKRKISALDATSCCASCGHGCKGGFPIESFNNWVRSGYCTGGDYGDIHSCKPYFLPRCVSDPRNNPEHLPACKGGEVNTPVCTATCDVKSYPWSYQKDKIFGKDGSMMMRDELSMMYEIVTNGPIVGQFVVYEDFYLYKTGVYTNPSGPVHSMGGHAIRIIGYGTENGLKYWLIANSWDKYWGLNGLMKYQRGVNLDGIEAMAAAGMPLIL